MTHPDLAEALAKHDIDLPEAIVPGIEAYVAAMWQWNEKLNLTRHTSWDLFVGRDLRDCVHLANCIEPGEEVLDLGSGNGVPGIVLSILRPDIDVALAESVAKRAAALNDIVENLGLPVPVYEARGEDLLEDFRFSSIVSRAVASVAKFCRWMDGNWSAADRLLLVKGPKWIEERGEARHLGLLAQLQLSKAATYPLGKEGEAGEGVILEIKPKRS